MRSRGQKRHPVTLHKPALVLDTDGGYTETFIPCSPSAWFAAIEPATPRDLERIAGGGVVASASHVVTMDFHPEMTFQGRVLFGARVFEVNGVRNIDERNIELVLACSEVLSGIQPTGTDGIIRTPGGAPSLAGGTND